MPNHLRRTHAWTSVLTVAAAVLALLVVASAEPPPDAAHTPTAPTQGPSRPASADPALGPATPHAEQDHDAHIEFVAPPDWARLRQRIGPDLLVLDLAALESPQAARLLAQGVRVRSGPQADIDCWLRGHGRPVREVLDAAAGLAARGEGDAPPPCNRIRVPDAS